MAESFFLALYISWWGGGKEKTRLFARTKKNGLSGKEKNHADEYHLHWVLCVGREKEENRLEM